MRFCPVYCVLLLLTFASTYVSAQSGQRSDDFNILFNEVRNGFESGNVGAFASHLASQVQINLRGEESGSYSSNQAYYILEKYLKPRKFISFEFTSISDTDATPYASGSAVFQNKGTRDMAQVYVSLMRGGDGWVIAEINIY